MIQWILAILLFVPISQADDKTISYTGFRMTLKYDVLTELISASLTNTGTSISPVFLGDFEEKFGSGFFSSSFSFKNFNCPTVTFNPSKAKFGPLKIDGSHIWVNATGAGLSLSCKFQYYFKIFEMTLFASDGTATMESTEIMIFQYLSERIIRSSVKAALTAQATVNGFSCFGAVNALANWLINKSVVDAFSVLFTKAFVIEATKSWDSWLNLKYPGKNVVFMNTFREVKNPLPGYLSISFDTVVTTSDDTIPLNNLAKVIKSPITAPKGAIQMCAPANLISHTLDILKQGKEYLIPIDPTKIGLTGTVKDLFVLLPNLQKTMDPSKKLLLGCSGGFYPIVRVKDSDDSINNVTVQAAPSCLFEAEEEGPLLSIDFRVRAIIIKTIEKVENLWTIKGTIGKASLYYLKEARVAAPQVLYSITTNIVNLLNGQTYEAGIPLSPIIAKYKATGDSTATKEEFCGEYA